MVKAQRNFDTKRYMGKWIEVSSILQDWSLPCSGATATYKMINENNIEVTNRCLNEKGEIVGMFTGHAKTKNPHERLGHFVVNFGRSSGDYIVLDSDYESYALVGGSTPDILWVLKRPNYQMTEIQYNSLVRKAKHNGYDIDKLKMSVYQ